MKSRVQISQLLGLSLVLLMAFMVQPADASIFAYTDLNPTGENRAGTFEEIHASYDDLNSKFSWSASFSEGKDGNLLNGMFPDGFWLVVSDGPNPKGDVDEYAIFYGDAETTKITSYVYNGENNASSWQTSDFLKAYEGALVVTEENGIKTLSFSIDVADVNNHLNTPDWDGAQFDEKIGIWFHPFVLEDSIEYNDLWQITNLPIEKQGWYDRANKMTSVVPEPTSLLLFGTGLAGAYIRRRKKA